LQFISIGHILNTCLFLAYKYCVASNLRFVKAVWRNYKAFNLHYDECCMDVTRTILERQLFYVKIKINTNWFDFVIESLIYAPTEFSDISLELQKIFFKLPKTQNNKKKYY
jgi:hypothetical protein